ncbi:MAG: hypothetical protein AB7F98_11585 [Novosphingobium sp.]
MKFFKMAFLAVGGLFLLGVALVGASGWWLSNNVDTVAEAAVDASGIKTEIANQQRERCSRARAAFDRMWDDAVDNNLERQREAAIEQAEADMKAACAAS